MSRDNCELKVLGLPPTLAAVHIRRHRSDIRVAAAFATVQPVCFPAPPNAA